MAPPAPGPDAGLQPADGRLLVDHGAGRRRRFSPTRCTRCRRCRCSTWPKSRAATAIAVLAGFFPFRVPALEELVHRRRGRHLPAAAVAGTGRGHAGGRRRGAGRLVAHLQALDQPDHQPRHGEHRHARRRHGVAGRRRACSSRSGWPNAAVLLLAMTGSALVYFLINTALITAVPYLKRGEVAHRGRDVRQLRLGRHQRRRQRAGRLPAVPRLPAGGHRRADRRRADGGDAR